MRHLLNTLFVFTENSYLSLDNGNVLVNQEDNVIGKFVLKNLEHILYFGYKGASVQLMGACAELGINLSFFKPNGKFLARICGETRGNVLLRKEQYRISDNEERSCIIARNFIVGKLINARWILERATRDHALRVNVDALKTVSMSLMTSARLAVSAEKLDELRGIEGKAAKCYFSVFDELLLQNKEQFFFHVRTRRPPLDNINALLSLAYSVLSNECARALEAVGLDPYVGFLHQDRPGRISLALDLMEELRPCFADRFVLSCVNNRIISPSCFTQSQGGAVHLNEDGRKAFFKAYQTRKGEKITHPFLGEKLPWGLVPYVQALLLARYIRGDIDAYPPFIWK